MHTKPVKIDCNFVVSAGSGGAGLGINSLKGPTVQNVFMHTSVSATAGNSNPASPNVVVTNPNPANGNIIVQFQDNYNRILSGFHIIQSPLSGSAVLVSSAGTVAGTAYVITVVGTTTAASWHELGVPYGVTPAVGVSFIAAATTTKTGTGAVQIAAATGAGIATIEILGNPTLSAYPNPTVSQGFGAQIILQCRDYAGTITAPADGSLISLSFLLSDSSVVVQGE